MSRPGAAGGLDPARAIVVGEHALTGAIADALGRVRVLAAPEEIDAADAPERLEVAVYCAVPGSATGEGPDLPRAERALERLVGRGVGHVVLVSSAEIQAPSHRHPGYSIEDRTSRRHEAHPIARRWGLLERTALRIVGRERLTVLRAAWVPTPGADDYASRLFGGRAAVKLAGHDPMLQILAPDDLARAVRLAAELRPAGTYNVAPDAAVSLHQGLRAAGVRRLSVPRFLQRPVRRLLARTGAVSSLHRTDYIRYPWTVSNAAARRELGFAPRRTSVEALAAVGARSRGRRSAHRASESGPKALDEHGRDKRYIDFYGRVLFRFVHDLYWRVELDGLENVPAAGPGVLVGVHRGFMPFDGVMAVHALATRRGRYPRFLVHPTLVKFPFLATFMNRMGGVIACQENADRVLARGQLLGVFPEGIRGAFSYYRDAYRLKKFGRGDFVRIALRNRAPVIPFVSVGPAEIFPVLAKIDWSWWKRTLEWPCLPITPTFPLVPLPLPSKWHTRFLEPLPFHESHPPEAADDARVVRAISREVRARMSAAIDDLRQRRKSVFWGSIFEEQRR